MKAGRAFPDIRPGRYCYFAYRNGDRYPHHETKA